MLFRLEKVGKEFSGRWIFQEVSAQCNADDRIGLIGGNGVGKTTLFDLIEGRLAPDEGVVIRSSSLSVSRVDQIAEFTGGRSVLEEALTVFEQLRDVESRMRLLESEMATDPARGVQFAHEYEELQIKFSLGGGYDYRSRTEQVLQGLGFAMEDLTLPCSHLSGGQRSRLLLGKALLSPSSLMLLDEPTNHLDLEGILWLTSFLRDLKTAFVVISHDRQFLDSVTQRTWELEGKRLETFSDGYSGSRRLREERRTLQLKEYERQQEWKRKTEDYVRRNIVGQKTKQAQSRRRQLENTEWLERPLVAKSAPVIKVSESGRGGAVTFEIHDAVVGYPGSPLIEGVNLTVRRGERIGILGGNGSGKTTLIRSIIGQIPFLKGTCDWGHNNSFCYYSQEETFDFRDLTVFDALAELNPGLSDLELRKFAALFLFQKDDVDKSVSQLSGGERSRLALARMLSRPANVLVFDEPTNHLDVQSREALESALSGFEGSLIVVSHDLYFLRKVMERYLLIRDRRLEEIDSIEELPGLLSRKEKRPVEVEKKVEKRSRPAEGLSKNERMRIEKRLSDIESEIAKMEEDRSKIEGELHRGNKDHLALAALSQTFHDLEEELKSLYQKWEELSETLEVN